MKNLGLFIVLLSGVFSAANVPDDASDIQEQIQRSMSVYRNIFASGKPIIIKTNSPDAEKQVQILMAVVAGTANPVSVNESVIEAGPQNYRRGLYSGYKPYMEWTDIRGDYRVELTNHFYPDMWAVSEYVGLEILPPMGIGIGGFKGILRANGIVSATTGYTLEIVPLANTESRIQPMLAYRHFLMQKRDLYVGDEGGDERPLAHVTKRSEKGVFGGFYFRTGGILDFYMQVGRPTLRQNWTLVEVPNTEWKERRRRTTVVFGMSMKIF